MNQKIQILRAFSIFAVICIHSNAEGIFAVIDRPFLNFSVAMFLFLSGYLTKAKIENIGAFYKKRIFKVLVPYVLWSVAYALVTGNIRSIGTLLVTGRAAAPLYFILVYIQFVFLSPLIGKLLRSRWKWLGYLITPVFLIVFRYILPYAAGVKIGFPFTEALFAFWFLYFYLGMAVGNSLLQIRAGFKGTTLLYAGALLLSEAEGLFWNVYGDFDMATTQLRLTSMLGSVAAIFLAAAYLKSERQSRLHMRVSKALARIGDCSSGLFFLHMAVIMVLSRVPGYDYLYFPFCSLLVFFVSIGCVLLGQKILGPKFSKYLGL